MAETWIEYKIEIKIGTEKRKLSGKVYQSDLIEALGHDPWDNATYEIVKHLMYSREKPQ